MRIICLQSERHSFGRAKTWNYETTLFFTVLKHNLIWKTCFLWGASEEEPIFSFQQEHLLTPLTILRHSITLWLISIDLFTDTPAILNLLDLRSIMGCQGGTRSVFTRAFRAKRELQRIFLGKKAIIITSKDGTTIFFCHYNLFLRKLKEKLARKARVNTDASIWDRAHAPWASHNTP